MTESAIVSASVSVVCAHSIDDSLLMFFGSNRLSDSF